MEKIIVFFPQLSSLLAISLASSFSFSAHTFSLGHLHATSVAELGQRPVIPIPLQEKTSVEAMQSSAKKFISNAE